MWTIYILGNNLTKSYHIGKVFMSVEDEKSLIKFNMRPERIRRTKALENKQFPENYIYTELENNIVQEELQNKLIEWTNLISHSNFSYFDNYGNYSIH